MNYLKGAAVIAGFVGAVFLTQGLEIISDGMHTKNRVERYRNMPYAQVIAEVSTIEEAEWYIKNYMTIKTTEGGHSFKWIHKKYVESLVDN